MALFMRGRRAELLTASVMTAHLFLCPFSKVEESFNLQATHDLLVLGVRNVSQFDHLEFPGVVPRTFMGSLVVAAFSQPIIWIISILGGPKFWMQLATRWVLGMMALGALVFFSDGVGMRFGRDTSRFFMLICSCQFHLLFYMTRTLPNVYALALVLLGLGLWLRGKWHRCVFLFTFTTVVFRGDTVVLLAPVMLSMLLSRRVSLYCMIWWGLSTAILSLLATVLVDSYFWQRWLWPEGEVLWFNVVQNKSSEWGVSPPLWYFSSALPRALQATALLIPLGLSMLVPTLFQCRSLADIARLFRVTSLVDWSVVSVAGPVFVYLALYSFLPHKELRFIFNAIPILNMVSAVGLAKLYRNRRKTRVAFVGASSCLALTFLGTIFFLAAAQSNYPGTVIAIRLHVTKLTYIFEGGEAFSHLHQVAKSEHGIPRSVHVDITAAMTGVSRFGEEFPAWRYSKDESLTTVKQLATFDYVLTAKDPAALEEVFEYVADFHAFSGIRIAGNRVAFQTRKLISLMRNHKVASGQA